jgi:hypothetical protein
MVTNHAPQMKNSRNIMKESFRRVATLIAPTGWSDVDVMTWPFLPELLTMWANYVSFGLPSGNEQWS